MVALHKAGISPNALTVAAVLLSAGLGVGFWLHPTGYMLLLVPSGLFLRMILNALDGMMARSYSLQSKSGELLNEFGDVISDVLIFLPLVKLYCVKWYLVVGFVVLAILNEFAGLLAKVISGTRRYDGPMGKSDRALFVGLLLLLLYLWPEMYAYINYCFVGSIFLILLSTFIRLRKSII